MLFIYSHELSVILGWLCLFCVISIHCKLYCPRFFQVLIQLANSSSHINIHYITHRRYQPAPHAIWKCCSEHKLIMSVAWSVNHFSYAVKALMHSDCYSESDCFTWSVEVTMKVYSKHLYVVAYVMARNVISRIPETFLIFTDSVKSCLV